MCLCEWLVVLRVFVASREIQPGPVSREGAKPRSQNIGYFDLVVLDWPRSRTKSFCERYQNGGCTW